MGFGVLRIELQYFLEVFFRLREIGLVHDAAFLVGCNAPGKKFAQIVVGLGEAFVDIDGGFIVFTGGVEVVGVNEELCLLKVGGGIVLVDLSYLVEIVLGFLEILQFNEEKGIMEVGVGKGLIIYFTAVNTNEIVEQEPKM